MCPVVQTTKVKFLFPKLDACKIQNGTKWTNILINSAVHLRWFWFLFTYICVYFLIIIPSSIVINNGLKRFLGTNALCKVKIIFEHLLISTCWFYVAKVLILEKLSLSDMIVIAFAKIFFSLTSSSIMNRYE